MNEIEILILIGKTGEEYISCKFGRTGNQRFCPRQNNFEITFGNLGLSVKEN